MNKTVVISTSSHDNYLFYLPFVYYAWSLLGWDLFCFILPDTNEKTKKEKLVFDTLARVSEIINNNCVIIPIFRIEGYEDYTIIQCARLYAANFFTSRNYLMTSDVDMMPLSDYWAVSPSEITSWGRDLTDYHYPICYIGMDQLVWKKVMGLTGSTMHDLKRDLSLMPNAKSKNKTLKWVTDQDLITSRLLSHQVTLINRGVDYRTNYPIGRVDRSAWEMSQQQTQRIDCHLPRPAVDESNFYKVMAQVKNQFAPKDEIIELFIKYRNEYVIS